MQSSRARALDDNIVKFVRFQLSTTIGAVLTVVLAPLAGLPEPFTTVQILRVAIMDGPPAVSFFNVFNARVERGAAFRKHFFENRTL